MYRGWGLCVCVCVVGGGGWIAPFRIIFNQKVFLFCKKGVIVVMSSYIYSS